MAMLEEKLVMNRLFFVAFQESIGCIGAALGALWGIGQ